MSNRLRSVGVGDQLGLGDAEGVLGLLRRGASRGSLVRGFPLGDAGRDGDEVVLLARAVPLRDPSWRQLRRLIRGAFGARGGGASHCDGGVFFLKRSVLYRREERYSGCGGEEGRGRRFGQG